MIEHGGWVYIVSSHSRCLYVGVTSDLHGRMWEHKNGVYEGFSKTYKTHNLVYQEFFDDIESAIALIEKMNRGWEDLTPSFSNPGPSTPARPS
jgi:putative endonuclease